MKLTVLVDNAVPVGSPLYGESGLALYLECDGKRLLFDTGASELLFHNAALLGIDLLALDYIVLSHHHSDHTGGLAALAEKYAALPLERRPELVFHPDLFAPRAAAHNSPWPPLVPLRTVSEVFATTPVTSKLRLTKDLAFLSGIPRTSHERQRVFDRLVREDGSLAPDTVPEEGVLAYRGKQGLVIVTGCTHCGVCNAVRHVKSMTGIDTVQALVGGLHLPDPPDDTLEFTAAILLREQVRQVVGMHCTGFESACFLARHLPVSELRAGEHMSFA